MNHFKRDNGFTLIEVLAVIIIIAALAAIAIPKLVSSTVNARQKADIATAHQVKAALDRYQVENGVYPDLTDNNEGEVTGAGFIPEYISKLDKTTTQQVAEGKEGFEVVSITDGVIPDSDPDAETYIEPTNLIMIYLLSDGLGAEVRAYDKDLELIWTSAN